MSFVDVSMIITSGCLVSSTAIQQIGPFREEFFIDQIDFDYCLRTRTKGWRIILTAKPLMEHGIGIPQKCSIFGKQLLSPNAAAIRHYYQTRNHLTLCREYIIKNTKWVFESLKVRIKETMLMLLCETERYNKMQMILKGAVHAFIGRLGPYQYEDER
jgi:rhamnosyltransferase